MLVDGAVARRGTLKLPAVEPMSAVDVPLPCAVPDAGEAQLTVRWYTTADQWFAPKGHLAAWDQVVLRTVRNRVAAIGDSVGGTKAIDRLLVSPVELSLWRAATDNDGFKLMPELRERIRVGGRALGEWLEAGVDRLPADELVDHRVERREVDGGIEYHHTVVVPPSLADLPRVGVTFALPPRFSEVRWFGRGPHENYPDRNRSAMLGTWAQAPDESPYLVPQEFGLRTDCRWFELVDPKKDESLRVDVLQPAALHCSATHFTAADLYAASTATELTPRKELIVHLDVAHRGIGTASCGPDVLPQYRIAAGTYRFAYRLTRY